MAQCHAICGSRISEYSHDVAQNHTNVTRHFYQNQIACSFSIGCQMATHRFVMQNFVALKQILDAVLSGSVPGP